MGSNLAKSPLAALFYGALLHFSVVFFPFGQGYIEAQREFSMPIMGYVWILVYALWVTLAVVISMSAASGAVSLVMLFLTMCGVQWLLPNLHLLWMGDPATIRQQGDIIFSIAAGVGCTLLFIVLCMLLFGKKPDEKPKSSRKPQPEAKYKLNLIGFLIRLLILPIIYTVLHFLTWYFLAWKNPEVRAFYRGSSADAGLVSSVIEHLLSNPSVLPLTLAQGLLYVLFALPILFRMQSKRVIFIVSLTMLYLSGSVQMLIPTPFVTDTVRSAQLLQYGAQLALTGVINGFLLHTVFRRIEAPATARATRPAAKEKAKGPTPKEQANAIKSTMNA